MIDQITVKRTARREMRDRLMEVTEQERLSGASALRRLARESGLLNRIHTLAAYVPHWHEADCLPIVEDWLAGGRRLLLPRVDSDDHTLVLHQVTDLRSQLVPGYRSIPEPNPELCPVISPESVEALLIPGLAFDDRGTRLGRGRGHYDRLLDLVPYRALRIAIGYDWQLLGAGVAPLPRETHDQIVHVVWTPSGETICPGGLSWLHQPAYTVPSDRGDSDAPSAST